MRDATQLEIVMGVRIRNYQLRSEGGFFFGDRPDVITPLNVMRAE